MQNRKQVCDSTNNSTKQTWRNDLLFVLNGDPEGNKRSVRERGQISRKILRYLQKLSKGLLDSNVFFYYANFITKLVGVVFLREVYSQYYIYT